MPRKSLMHHDIQKNTSYHNFYLFFPICKRKEFKLFQLLENFKKNVPMHHPSIKKSLANPIIFSLVISSIVVHYLTNKMEFQLRKTNKYRRQKSKIIITRHPVPSTDQAIPSCFYFRISWILMEQRCFYFFVTSNFCRTSKVKT